MEPSRRSPSEAPPPRGPAHRAAVPRRWRAPNQGRLCPPPAGLCPARLLPMPIRPWLRCHQTREAPQPPPRVTRGPSPRRIAHRCLLPLRGSRVTRVGRPASVGGRGQVGTGRGSSPRSTTRRGGAASLRSARVSGARTLPLFPSQAPLTPWLCPHRGREPQLGGSPAPRPSNSPPLSGEAWSGESAELARGTRDALSQRYPR